MRRLLFIVSVLLMVSTVHAQEIDKLLSEIEKNNVALQALEKQINAQRLGNKTGIYLENPEVEFHYLWGNPSGMGRRTDWAISQSFDFPTAYGYRKQIAESKNEQLHLEYEKQRRQLLLNARLLATDLVYHNALKLEIEARVEHAQRIADSYQTKLNAGDANRLDFNKAQINLLNLKKELEAIDVEQSALLAQLKTLNGEKTFAFSQSKFEPLMLSADFEQWFLQAEQSNPLLAWLKQELEISEKQMKLTKAENMPKLHAGYMSEKVVGEAFRGVSVGVSIPLWENKNTVKREQLNALAIESAQQDVRLQFYGQLNLLYSKAKALEKNVNDYKSALETFNNSALLQKAFDAGEISLLEYMLESAIHYKSVNNILEMEKELNQVVAELYQYVD